MAVLQSHVIIISLKEELENVISERDDLAENLTN